MATDLNRTVQTGYSSIAALEMDNVHLDTVQDQEETYDINSRWQTDWNLFMGSPKLYSAILMKAIWTVGKGYTADVRTMEQTKIVDGNGKETFKDILFSMVVTKQVFGDSYAEIIWNDEKKRDWPINLRILDASRVRKVFDRDGRIKAYDLLKPSKGLIGKIKDALKGGVAFERFEREDIFHLTHNRFAASMHGRSVPQQVEKIVLADEENFRVMQKLTRFQAVPFIIFKVKENDQTTIDTFKSNIKDARDNGEDMIIPDDKNILSWEVVQVSPSAILMDWRTNVNSELYRAVGMPLILFGSAGSTETGGKVEYLGHETVFENDQGYIEEQVETQLHWEIDLYSPTSLLENLKADENKDSQNALTFQPQDATGGRNS